MAKASQKKKPKKIEISDKTKNILIGSVTAITLIGGGCWAYMTYSTVPPPVLVTGAPPEKAEEVALYLGNSRGFGRLSTEQQEQYLVRAFQTFAPQPEARARYIQSLRRMSTAERQVLSDAVFDISREHVMQYAEDYANTPSSQREAFINKAFKDFETLRTQITGGGGGGGAANSLSDPLKGNVPTNGDELMKTVFTRTDAAQRDKAVPFLDAMAAKYKADKAAARK